MHKINHTEARETLSPAMPRQSGELIEVSESIKDGKRTSATVPDHNATARRELAMELLQQGLTEEAVCRILNIRSNDLPCIDEFEIIA